MVYGSGAPLLDEQTIYPLFERLVAELGPDIVGLVLIGLAQAAMEGKVGDEGRKLVRDALNELIEAQEERGVR